MWHCEDDLNRLVWDPWSREERLGCHHFTPHHQQGGASGNNSGGTVEGDPLPAPGNYVSTWDRHWPIRQPLLQTRAATGSKAPSGFAFSDLILGQFLVYMCIYIYFFFLFCFLFLPSSSLIILVVGLFKQTYLIHSLDSFSTPLSLLSLSLE